MRFIIKSFDCLLDLCLPGRHCCREGFSAIHHPFAPLPTARFNLDPNTPSIRPGSGYGLLCGATCPATGAPLRQPVCRSLSLSLSLGVVSIIFDFFAACYSCKCPRLLQARLLYLSSKLLILQSTAVPGHTLRSWLLSAASASLCCGHFCATRPALRSLTASKLQQE